MATLIKEGMTGAQVASVIEQNFKDLETKIQDLSIELGHVKTDLNTALNQFMDFIKDTYKQLLPTMSNGATDNRPSDVNAGYMYFDTTINKPIWYNGTRWVDATGIGV